MSESRMVQATTDRLVVDPWFGRNDCSKVTVQYRYRYRYMYVLKQRLKPCRVRIINEGCTEVRWATPNEKILYCKYLESNPLTWGARYSW